MNGDFLWKEMYMKHSHSTLKMAVKRHFHNAPDIQCMLQTESCFNLQTMSDHFNPEQVMSTQSTESYSSEGPMHAKPFRLTGKSAACCAYIPSPVVSNNLRNYQP